MSILRIITGLLFLEHGTAKFLHIPPLPMLSNVPQLSFFGILGLIEIIGGALVMLGVYSRWIAFLLSGEMAVAYFMVHVPQGFFPLLNNGEPAIYFCFAFLYLAAAGPGPIAVNQK